MNKRYYTQTGYVNRWDTQPYARRVVGLTKEERQMVRSGTPVYLADCPEYRGETDRLIYEFNGRFYCRMP